MPLACAAASPSAIWLAYSIALRSASGALRSSALAEHLAVQQLHDDEAHAVGLADVVDGEDVRMRQRRRPPAPRARSARGASGSFGEVVRKDLDRDIAIRAGVSRAVDFAHPAGTDQRDDLVRAEPGAGRESHRSFHHSTAARSGLLNTLMSRAPTAKPATCAQNAMPPACRARSS